uniref:Beta-glucuronidase n=1 Tax=Dermatophagoides pteronyssinus TaxID=6956 RepID=A0A6P6Y3K9_DERPT|nr:beta-glucuronidase-like [Dermatophagoides pteronyssinus]
MSFFRYKMLLLLLSLLFLIQEKFSVETQTINDDSLAIYPWPTETRETLSLDGIWTFRITDYSFNNELYGFQHHWFNQSLDLIDEHYERMPVPSSFNDITEKRKIRDFVGWSWYDRKFFLPKNYHSNDNDIIIRFGSVNYKAIVWINGNHIMNHTGGHLPFQTIIKKDYLHMDNGNENHITVAVNNELSHNTIPQGSYKIKNDTRTKSNRKFIESNFGFDFYNYAGIQRSVLLYFVPKIRITDLTIITDVIDQNNGIIHFNVTTNIQQQQQDKFIVQIDVFDRYGKLVNSSSGKSEGSLIIPNVHLWWPFTMHSEPGYLYRMSISLYHSIEMNKLIDRYYQNIGIRTIHIDKENYQFLVNGQPFYFRGFGKHEEYDIRGRSLDPVMIIKDFNLIKWIGANSFRTSHYPYSEQIMDEADIQGIVVIDECPAVGLSAFNPILLKQHLQTIREMIERDKNRPSVFMWSIANEASSGKIESENYFQNVSELARQLDQSNRPITAADNQYNQDYLPQFLDVIMINRYYGWYSDTGYPQIIKENLINDFIRIWKKYQKPIMISEYGADTISGMHQQPSIIFTEDYQSEIMIESHQAFDQLRSKGFFIGEHIWNFADFMTQQSLTRVGGNKKGIFTRQRQPKTSARLLRCRYWMLANITNHDYHDDEHSQGFSYCPNVQYF